MTEWSNDTVLLFLELYEGEPVLWNPKHRRHKDKIALHDAWLRISESLNKPVDELGKKKESLLTAYRRHARKKKQSIVSGDVETVVWSKTTVESTEGDKKSEVFQSGLPYFRERRVLGSFDITQLKKRSFNHKCEVILTKETNKDGDVLVVYKPEEGLSAVYKMYNKKNSEAGGEGEGGGRRALREVALCRACAPCYQASWRGNQRNQPNVRQFCPVCKRPSISVYNLLTHLKTHSDREIRPFKAHISKALAEVVDYHYCCRICQKRLTSIRELRQHVRSTHKALAPFTCEIGNHLTT